MCKVLCSQENVERKKYSFFENTSSYLFEKKSYWYQVATALEFVERKKCSLFENLSSHLFEKTSSWYQVETALEFVFRRKEVEPSFY